jgi:membrane associated rhomboid family serine protease
MNYRGYSKPGLGVVVYIIITCFILFIASYISPRFESYLGFVPRLFLDRPWTILTSIFMHAGIMHILFNMFTLYFFGSFLTSLVGDVKFLIVFLVGGIAGNLLFMAFPSNAFYAVVGASGAIFAVGGTLAVMRPRLPVFVFPIPVPIPLWVAILGGFALTFGAAMIAWEAHLGGLAFGLLAGLFFRYRETRRIF